jgi:hypothetical protein
VEKIPSSLEIQPAFAVAVEDMKPGADGPSVSMRGKVLRCRNRILPILASLALAD